MMQTLSFIVTDIETDGPQPGRNSMISIASAAIGADGESQGTFKINLRPLSEATADCATMMWWQSEPLAWEEATRDQQAPEVAMRAWADWVKSRPGDPVFAAHPLSFDGPWMDWYLQKFIGCRLFKHPRDPSLCVGAGLDIPSLVMGVTGWDYRHCSRDHYPAGWLGNYRHNHFALYDVLGYAHLLGLILTGTVSRSVSPKL
ncbi:DNA polymerase III subunit epsilon [Rhizobium sp. A37_96]